MFVALSRIFAKDAYVFKTRCFFQMIGSKTESSDIHRGDNLSMPISSTRMPIRIWVMRSSNPENPMFSYVFPSFPGSNPWLKSIGNSEALLHSSCGRPDAWPDECASGDPAPSRVVFGCYCCSFLFAQFGLGMFCLILICSFFFLSCLLVLSFSLSFFSFVLSFFLPIFLSFFLVCSRGCVFPRACRCRRVCRNRGTAAAARERLPCNSFVQPYIFSCLLEAFLWGAGRSMLDAPADFGLKHQSCPVV